jgi:hypothetical protein
MNGTINHQTSLKKASLSRLQDDSLRKINSTASHVKLGLAGHVDQLDESYGR